MPTRKEVRTFGLAFLLTLVACAVAWALTTDQIWQNVFDSTNNALRVNIVAP